MGRRYSLIVATLLVGLLLVYPSVHGQNLSTDWIAEGQNWVRIRTSERGLVRLKAGDLPEMPDTIRPEYFHLYFRGLEQVIYVEKNSEFPYFSGDDFIEFICDKNDGRLEAMLYRDPNTGRPAPELAPTTFVSQFDDTAAYYLTWNSVQRADQFTYRNLEQSADSSNRSLWYMASVRKDFDVSNGLYLTGGGSNYDPFFDMNTDYVTGEGYLDRPFSWNAVHTLDVPYAELSSIDSALVLVRLVGRNYIRHRVRLSIGVHAAEYVYDNISYQTCSLRFPVSELASGKVNVTLTALGGNVSVADVNAICWIECQYPRRLAFPETVNGEVVRWRGSPDRRESIAIDTRNDRIEILAFDPYTRSRQLGHFTLGGRYFFSSLPQGSSRELWLFSSDRINFALQDVQVFQPDEQLLDPPDVDLIVLTHRGLMRSAQAYVDYRISQAPRSVSAHLVLVEDLYEHYSYGSSHPQAIKEYLRRLLVKPVPSLKYVMFWGQGRYAKTWGKSHVPTWGYPASDKEFVSRFDPDFQEEAPLAAIGRVNILNDEQGFAYLDKLRQYELQTHQPWMQRVIHAGGGGNIGEQTNIERFLIRNDSLVSAVGFQPFRYQNRIRPNPSDPAFPDRDQLMRDGALFVQAFGHTDHNATDVFIREPTWYGNEGRYYVMLMNGCYSSDFANSPLIGTLGERFIRQKGAGAVAFMASSGVGYVQVMGSFTERFYELAFRDSSHLGLGDLVQHTISSFIRSGSSSGQIWRNHLRQFHLQGCPVLSMKTPHYADFVFSPRYLKLEPLHPSLGDTLLRFELEIRNTGRYCPDSIELVVEHWAELNSLPAVPVYRLRIPPFNRNTVISLTLLLSEAQLKPGLNRLHFRLNPDIKVTELNYSNNDYVFDWVLPGRQPLLVHPSNYAVIGTDTVDLVALLPGLPHLQPVNCWFELDTVPDFTSPFCKRSESISQLSGRIKWRPQVAFADSQVYFWRMRVADMSPTQWVCSSFQWIKGRSGWGQAHSAQLLELDRDGLNYGGSPSLWLGEDEPHELTVGVWPNTFSVSKNRQRASDSIDFRFWSTTLFYAVIDRNSLEVLTADSVFGIVKPVDPVRDSTTLEQLIGELDDNHFIVLFSKLPQFHLWPSINIDQLKLIGGSTRIDSIRQSSAFCTGFILIGQKNLVVGSANERFLFGPTNGMTIDSTLYIQSARGLVQTLRIGPATRWGLLASVVDSPSGSAQHIIHLVGRNRIGQVDSLARWSDSLLGEELRELVTESHQTLQLAWEVNGQSGTPLPQLKRWHVLFDPVAEFALSANNLVPQNLRIRSGTTISLPLTVWMIYGPQADSLELIIRWIKDTGETIGSEQLWVIDLVDQKNIDYSFLAPSHEGFYRIIAELNPQKIVPERYLFNNQIEFAVEVFEVRDTTVPRLEVFLNGNRARNGMLTQANPSFQIRLTDDPSDAPLNRSSDCLIWLSWYNPLTHSWTEYQVTDLFGSLSFGSTYQSGVINQATWNLNLQRLALGLWELVIQPNGPPRQPWITDMYRLQFVVEAVPSTGDWTLAPNPAYQRFTLISPYWGKNRPVQVSFELVDGTGRRILSSTIDTELNPSHTYMRHLIEPQAQLNTSLPAGIYFWRVLSRFSDGHSEFSPYNKLIWLGY